MVQHHAVMIRTIIILIYILQSAKLFPIFSTAVKHMYTHSRAFVHMLTCTSQRPVPNTDVHIFVCRIHFTNFILTYLIAVPEAFFYSILYNLVSFSAR